MLLPSDSIATPAAGFRGGAGWVPLGVEEVDGMMADYEVLSLLGCGGMGAVYLALQTGLNRAMAVKILPLELSLDEDHARRFVREARAMARLNHPHITPVYEFGKTETGQLFYVMEFVDGGCLKSLIPAGGMEPERALSVVAQVCAALVCAHAEGIVHRDIKPGNVLVDQEGRVKVTDFGIARVVEPGAADLTLTRAGQVLGTPDYTAPEQLQGAEAGPRADIFSVGVMLYEMLCGEVPRGVFTPPSRRVKCGTRVDAIVDRAMRQDPAERFQNMTEMLAAVEAARRGPRRNVFRLRRALVPALAVVGVLAALGAGAFYFAGEKGQSPPSLPGGLTPADPASAVSRAATAAGVFVRPPLRETAEWLFQVGGTKSSLTLSLPGGKILEVRNLAELPEGEWPMVALWLDRFDARPEDRPVTREEFVRHTAGLTGLRDVFFRYLYLHDSDFSFLANNPELEIVRIEGSPVTDAVLAPLSRLRRLRVLTIGGSRQFTGQGLAGLDCLPVLQDFAVPQTAFNDAAAQALAGCPGLRVVELSQTAITDDSLPVLRARPALEELYLDYTEVTGAGVAGLSGLRNLKVFSAIGQEESTLRALREALPECRIGQRP